MERESYEEMQAFEEGHWWFVARRSILQSVLDRHLLHQEVRNVLEVGCGSGGNLQMLSSFGAVSAMEMDDEARAFANARNLCRVRKGKLPDDIPFEDHFDLICMLDVLEHVDDDFSSLAAVKKRLSRNGTLLITVPAYRFLWSLHDLAHHHRRRYTRGQLEDIVSRAGLRVRYCTYFNTILFPFVAAVRTLKNVLGRTTTDLTFPPGPVNRLLTAIFASERNLLPAVAYPFGVSILLIAEKEERGSSDP